MSDELKPLSKKHQQVLSEYLLCWSQWKAYHKIYPSVTPESARVMSSKLFADANFSAHLKARLDEVHMSADEALKLLAQIAHADMGVFWKVVDEWMFNPLSSYEILDEREVLDDSTDPPKMRISYRVRHVALDTDKLVDPQYSRLIQEFTDSRKSGLSIKTYNKHDAVKDVLKVHGRFAPEKLEVSTPPEGLTIKIVKASDATGNSNQ